MMFPHILLVILPVNYHVICLTKKAAFGNLISTLIANGDKQLPISLNSELHLHAEEENRPIDY